MKTRNLFILLYVSSCLVATATAVPKRKVLKWKTSEGTVVFSGSTHADAGLKCKDCHPKIFKKKKHGATKMTMAELDKGEYCGTCHNGEIAFSTTSKANCKKCHSGKEV